MTMRYLVLIASTDITGISCIVLIGIPKRRRGIWGQVFEAVHLERLRSWICLT